MSGDDDLSFARQIVHSGILHDINFRLKYPQLQDTVLTYVQKNQPPSSPPLQLPLTSASPEGFSFTQSLQALSERLDRASNPAVRAIERLQKLEEVYNAVEQQNDAILEQQKLLKEIARSRWKRDYPSIHAGTRRIEDCAPSPVQAKQIIFAPTETLHRAPFLALRPTWTELMHGEDADLHPVKVLSAAKSPLPNAEWVDTKRLLDAEMHHYQSSLMQMRLGSLDLENRVQEEQAKQAVVQRRNDGLSEDLNLTLKRQYEAILELKRMGHLYWQDTHTLRRELVRLVDQARSDLERGVYGSGSPAHIQHLKRTLKTMLNTLEFKNPRILPTIDLNDLHESERKACRAEAVWKLLLPRSTKEETVKEAWKVLPQRPFRFHFGGLTKCSVAPSPYSSEMVPTSRFEVAQNFVAAEKKRQSRQATNWEAELRASEGLSDVSPFIDEQFGELRQLVKKQRQNSEIGFDFAKTRETLRSVRKSAPRSETSTLVKSAKESKPPAPTESTVLPNQEQSHLITATSPKTAPVEFEEDQPPTAVADNEPPFVAEEEPPAIIPQPPAAIISPPPSIAAPLPKDSTPKLTKQETLAKFFLPSSQELPPKKFVASACRTLTAANIGAGNVYRGESQLSVSSRSGSGFNTKRRTLSSLNIGVETAAKKLPEIHKNKTASLKASLDSSESISVFPSVTTTPPSPASTFILPAPPPEVLATSDAAQISPRVRSDQSSTVPESLKDRVHVKRIAAVIKSNPVTGLNAQVHSSKTLLSSPKRQGIRLLLPRAYCTEFLTAPMIYEATKQAENFQFMDCVIEVERMLGVSQMGLVKCYPVLARLTTLCNEDSIVLQSLYDRQRAMKAILKGGVFYPLQIAHCHQVLDAVLLILSMERELTRNIRQELVSDAEPYLAISDKALSFKVVSAISLLIDYDIKLHISVINYLLEQTFEFDDVGFAVGSMTVLSISRMGHRKSDQYALFVASLGHFHNTPAAICAALLGLEVFARRAMHELYSPVNRYTGDVQIPISLIDQRGNSALIESSDWDAVPVSGMIQTTQELRKEPPAWMPRDGSDVHKLIELIQKHESDEEVVCLGLSALACLVETSGHHLVECFTYGNLFLTFILSPEARSRFLLQHSHTSLSIARILKLALSVSPTRTLLWPSIKQVTSICYDSMLLHQSDAEIAACYLEALALTPWQNLQLDAMPAAAVANVIRDAFEATADFSRMHKRPSRPTTAQHSVNTFIAHTAEEVRISLMIFIISVCDQAEIHRAIAISSLPKSMIDGLNSALDSGLEFSITSFQKLILYTLQTLDHLIVVSSEFTTAEPPLDFWPLYIPFLDPMALLDIICNAILKRFVDRYDVLVTTLHLMSNVCIVLHQDLLNKLALDSLEELVSTPGFGSCVKVQKQMVRLVGILRARNTRLDGLEGLFKALSIENPTSLERVWRFSQRLEE